MEFLGYTRPSGPAGIRNYVMVLPLVRCANELAWTIAEGVDSVVPLMHNHACLRLGEDNERAKKTFIGLGPATTKGYIKKALDLDHQLIAVSDNKYTVEDDMGFYEIVCGRNAGLSVLV